MKAAIYALLILAEAFIWPLSSNAQQQGGQNISESNRLSGWPLPTRVSKRWDISGKVVTLQGDAVPGAKIEAESISPSKQQSLTSNSVGSFQASFQLTMAQESGLSLRLTVKKKGFFTAHALVEYAATGENPVLQVTLLPEHLDGDMLPREDLVSALGHRLRELGRLDGLSAKSEKDYAQGAADLLDLHEPDKAAEAFKNVVKRDPNCSKCRTMLAVAELEAGDLDGAVHDATLAADISSKSSNSRSSEASLLLGVIRSWKYDPSGAADYFGQALAASPGDALTLMEMGRAQLQNRSWASADSYLSKALAAGAGPEARLLRVKALLGEGQTDQATAEMKRYLGNRNLKDMPLQVHMVWDAIQVQKELRTTYENDSGSAKGINYLKDKLPELKGLQAAGSQEPLSSILQAVGRNVSELFQGFQSTSSMEEVREEWGSPRGKVKDSLNQKYRYLCLLSGEDAPPFFNEYRQSLDAAQGETFALKRGFMLTAGFVSSSLNFLPAFQPDSTFHYLGRQEVDGRETYVVSFAQLPLKTKLSGAFNIGLKSVATYTQELAWIDSQNYQILRLRTDLLKPLEEVKLTQQTTQIDYQEVHFKNSPHGFWLPRQVEVTVKWNGRRYHNEHRYAEFLLFDVNTHEKIGEPKSSAVSSRSN